MKFACLIIAVIASTVFFSPNLSADCNDFATKLEACTPYKCSNAKSASVSSHSSPTGENTIKYKINGKEVRNPMQEAADNGSCKISGYGNK